MGDAHSRRLAHQSPGVEKERGTDGKTDRPRILVKTLSDLWHSPCLQLAALVHTLLTRLFFDCIADDRPMVDGADG